MLTEYEALALLRDRINEAGGGNAFARLHGFSGVYVNQVRRGDLPMAARMLKAIGLEHVPAYRRLKK